MYSSLSDIIQKKGSSIVERLEPMNIIEFAESKQGLDMTLFPMQKFILKTFYKLPLSEDINENRIIIRDMFNEVTLHEFSERETIDFLYKNKLINMNYEDIYEKKLPFSDVMFFVGRRGSKTKMTNIIIAYSLYELLFYDNPHWMFNNKPVTDEISVTVVSNHSRGGNRQFRELIGLVAKSKFFRPYIAGKTKDGYWFKTKEFMRLEKLGHTENLGNIRVSSSAANYGVRGDANLAGALDEFCHLMDSENNDKENPLDKAMWEALAPSTYEYVATQGPAKGKSFGKMFILSSPNGKKGLAYQMYEESFEKKTRLMLNMPSFYVNITLDSNKLKADYDVSESSYEQEILAKFTSKISKWIHNPNLILAASNKNNPNILGWNVNKNYTYYMGIDFALRGDLMSFAIVHTEPTIPANYSPIEDKYAGLLAQDGQIYVVDYIYSNQAQPGTAMDIEYLVKQVSKAIYIYGVRKGAYDQWSRDTIEKFLKKFSVNNVLECMSATQVLNNSMASIYKQLVMEGRIITPNDEDTYPDYSGDWNMTYLDEVFRLVEYRGRNGLIKVENPSGHDDRYKAVEKAIYLAYTKAAPLSTSLYGSNEVSVGIPGKGVIGGGANDMYNRYRAGRSKKYDGMRPA